MRLIPAAAQAIGMALHELGTNAGKYGALSNDDGRVIISSGLSADGSMFILSWVEENGPPVVAPTHSGFGRKVIESMVELALDGTTEIAYPPSGFTWAIEAPVSEVLETAPHRYAERVL